MLTDYAGATLWIILAVILIVVESCTVNLITVWFAVGALAAAVAAGIGADGYWQIGLFVLLSSILIALTKPLAKKIRKKKVSATNGDRIIGQTGIVISDILPSDAAGQIKVMGQIWSASSADGTVIPKDKEVMVEGIIGVKATVRVSA